METCYYAGIAKHKRIIWKKDWKNNKTRLSVVKVDTSSCAMTAVRYDKRLGTFYQRLKRRKGSAKAIVATAKEILVIIWYMLTRRELYRSMNKERYQQKLSRIKNIKQSLV